MAICDGPAARLQGMRFRDDHGQASIEHLALVALVATVLLAAGAVAVIAGPSVTNRVTTAFQRALCTVRAERCALLDREPCPVLRTTDTTSQGLTVTFLRLSHDRVLFIERRSDGGYVMSLVEGLKGGVGVSAGVRGPGALSFGVEASALAGGRAGRTYTAATAREARALVERLRRQRLPAVRSLVAGAADLAGLERADPAVSSYVVGGDVAADVIGSAGLGHLLGAKLSGEVSGGVGVRVAAHEREVTVYAQAGVEIGAFFSALDGASVGATPAGRGNAGAGGGPPGGAAGPDEPLGSVTNPLALQASATAMAGGTVALRFGPGPELRGIEVVGQAEVGQRQEEVRARIDPADPAVRQAFEVWRADPTGRAALASLGRAATGRAALDRRTFAVGETTRDFGFEASLGAGIGGHAARQLVTGRLTEQRSRPVGGVWEQRLDCAMAARSAEPRGVVAL